MRGPEEIVHAQITTALTQAILVTLAVCQTACKNDAHAHQYDIHIANSDEYPFAITGRFARIYRELTNEG